MGIGFSPPPQAAHSHAAAVPTRARVKGGGERGTGACKLVRLHKCRSARASRHAEQAVVAGRRARGGRGRTGGPRPKGASLAGGMVRLHVERQ